MIVALIFFLLGIVFGGYAAVFAGMAIEKRAVTAHERTKEKSFEEHYITRIHNHS